MKKSLHIFKPGRQTPMSGAPINFTESDLATCAKAYDPARHEAPLVVGHPAHDAPAYGWVKSLHSGPDGLIAEPQQVDTAFAEMVDTGRFKKISASFYTPDSPHNPVPGIYYLRHVGFLGAMPPAVKGLRQVEFAETEEGVVEFSDSEDSGMVARLYDWLIAKFGKTAVDELTSSPPDDLPTPTSIKEKTMPEGKETPSTADQVAVLTSENERLKTSNETQQAEIEALKKKLADLEAKEKETEGEKIEKEAEDFAEGLIKQGQLAPKHKDMVVTTLKTLAADSTLQFGEGKKKRPLSEVFQEFLGEMPQVVSFGEHATKGRAGNGVHGSDSADFAEKNVDAGRLSLHEQASALSRDQKIPYEQAIRRLIK